MDIDLSYFILKAVVLVVAKEGTKELWKNQLDC